MEEVKNERKKKVERKNKKKEKVKETRNNFL